MNCLSKLISSLIVLCAMNHIHACTAFHLQAKDGAKIYCRTMEYGFPLDSDILIVPQGMDLTGTGPENKPGLKWKSKYGHIGMNQSLSRLLVSDGMNEKGLVVGQLYLPGYAKYETSDPARTDKTLGPWEVASFLLSTCATVDEAINALSTVLVANEPMAGTSDFIMPLHYYICDASGASVVVEYIEGMRLVYNNQLGVLTNSPPFRWHMMNLSNFINLSPVNVIELDLVDWDIKNVGQGSGLLGLPGDPTPPSRFVRAALFSQWSFAQNSAMDAIRMGFHILNTFDLFEGLVRRNPNEKNSVATLAALAKTDPASITTSVLTQWAIVHDRTNLKTYFRSYESLRIQMIDLKKIDFTQSGLKYIPVKKSFDVEEITTTSKSIKS